MKVIRIGRFDVVADKITHVSLVKKEEPNKRVYEKVYTVYFGVHILGGTIIYTTRKCPEKGSDVTVIERELKIVREKIIKQLEEA